MNSTKAIPFDWNITKPSLFTPSEKAHMRNNAVAKTIKPKEMKIYSRAGAK